MKEYYTIICPNPLQICRFLDFLKTKLVADQSEPKAVDTRLRLKSLARFRTQTYLGNKYARIPFKRSLKNVRALYYEFHLNKPNQTLDTCAILMHKGCSTKLGFVRQVHQKRPDGNKLLGSKYDREDGPPVKESSKNPPLTAYVLHT